ncbi:MAG: hypothetical protein H0W24_01990 [Lysobacter sp.]|nr:hypothetical protein [Lysobacter sp.]
MAAMFIALAACNMQTSQAPSELTEPATSGDRNANFGAVSVDEPTATQLETDVFATTDWPAIRVTSGTASISCELDYASAGDGVPLVNLEFFSVLDAMSACKEAGVVRLRYAGKIASDFTGLVERVSAMADRMEIRKRVLDIDSSGGQVEYAMRAGDLIGGEGWTIWVREDAICHSSCVLVLGAGDNRLISGKVGIHRIIRLQSEATSRAELNRELRDVHGKIEEYLSRNGVAIAVADLMMTVPNRSLRLLTDAELEQFGLGGVNAVQDDLDRIRLARKCGEDFVRRRDDFFRSFDRTCMLRDQDVETMGTCGLELRERFGFPDDKCRADSPLSEYDERAAAEPAKSPATG